MAHVNQKQKYIGNVCFYPMSNVDADQMIIIQFAIIYLEY